MSALALHHAVQGPDGAPALVLAGSLGTALTLWDPVMPELTRAFRVVRYDHRGQGGSPSPRGPYSMADLGADAVALLDRLGIERASFCGLSLGGMVAFGPSTQLPDRLHTLALPTPPAFLA